MPYQSPKPFAGKRCSTADADRICELFERGYSHVRIARALGHSRGSVSYQLMRAGLLRRPDKQARPSGRFTAEQDRRMLDMRVAGLSIAAIAESLGERYRSIQSRLDVLTRREAVTEEAA